MSWDETTDWLVESLADKPIGFILEVGPRNYVTGEENDEDEDVVCAQIQVLAGGVLMLRRSRTELGHLLLVDYSTDDLVLEQWYFDDHFEDCTDGYLFSRDVTLLAHTCVTWIQENEGNGSTNDIGCNYRFPDTLLPPPDPTS
ncbi:hypothetical protein CA951_02795 [Rhodococcus sp. NCIMB 12038]|nr:hypothetical protein [Rhodococcus sp. NCIMB 12038]OUS97448.1 hypothetical protein CA951_02795 [Rhodococcus sp. NCIMB 12038]